MYIISSFRRAWCLHPVCCFSSCGLRPSCCTCISCCILVCFSSVLAPWSVRNAISFLYTVLYMYTVLYKIQDSRSWIVTHTYRICSEMKKWNVQQNNVLYMNEWMNEWMTRNLKSWNYFWLRFSRHLVMMSDMSRWTKYQIKEDKWHNIELLLPTQACAKSQSAHQRSESHWWQRRVMSDDSHSLSH